MEKDTTLAAIVAAMDAAFDGRDGEDWFDGLRATLENVDAATASRSPFDGRSSLAAHLRHLVYSFEVMNARFSGFALEPDWEDAWKHREVTPEEWTALQAKLETERQALAAKIRERPEPSLGFLESAIKSITHLGYHIGAMRQMLLDLR